MNLTLFRNFSDNRKIGKTLETLFTTSAIWLDETSILSPIFIISGNENTLTANYLYCERTGRYYFISDITLDSGGRKILKCNIDPLETYKNYLLSKNVHIVRDSEKPTYTKDSKLPMKPFKSVDVIKFQESEFNLSNADDYSYNFVLVVAGGGTNAS